MARTLVASDNFNRAGPGLGSNWAQLYSAGAGDVQIYSSDRIANDYTGFPGAGGAARWVGPGTFSNDQYASLAIDVIDDFASTNYNVGVICRASADTEGSRDFYYACVATSVSGGNYSVSFGKVVNGTRTQFYAGFVAFAVGDRIELEVEGSTIRVCKNGVALGGSFTTTDTALTTGKPGVTAAGSSAAIAGDDWEGGDITSSTTRRGQVSWSELEVPNVPHRAQVSWAELEVPNVPHRAQVSWAELEVPDAPRRGQVSFAEFEVPNVGTTPDRANVSWAELEVPDVPHRAQVSWAEFEIPNVPHRAQVSWAELEVPNVPHRGQVSWVELEVPNSPARAQVSWAEFVVPDVGGGGGIFYPANLTGGLHQCRMRGGLL